MTLESVVNTPAVVLVRVPTAPRSVAPAGQPQQSFGYAAVGRLLCIHFTNEAKPRDLAAEF